MRRDGPVFWVALTVVVLVATWGAWRWSAPPLHHLSIIVERIAP